MIRYTTPTHKFSLQNLDPAIIEKIKITYAQQGRVILEKRDDEISLDGNVATVRLKQKETAKFVAGATVEIQLRVLTVEGDAIASNIIITTVSRILDDEVLTNGDESLSKDVLE